MSAVDDNPLERIVIAPEPTASERRTLSNSAAGSPRQAGASAWFRRTFGWLGRQLIGMTVWNLIVGNITFAWVPFVGAALLYAFFGWKFTPPEAVREKVQGVGRQIGNAASHIPLIGKTPEQAEVDAARKEAQRKEREESEIRQWKARADLIGFRYDDTWTVEKYRVEVPAAEHRKNEADRLARIADEEDRKKKPYYERADKIGFRAEPSWDLKTLERQVEDAEREIKLDADYQAALRKYERDCDAYQERLRHGPNAKCPERRCGWTFHTNRTSGQFGCSRCNGFYNIRSARASWTPPPPPKEPPPPRKTPSIWGRLKSLVP